MKRFVNGACETVGPVSFTPNASDFVTLAIDESNVPHVAFSDATVFTYKCPEMRYPDGTSVADAPEAGRLTLWRDHLQDLIHVGNTPPGAVLQLLDRTGREIDRSRSTGTSTTIRTAHLAEGLYLVQVEHQGRVKGGKVVVAR